MIGLIFIDSQTESAKISNNFFETLKKRKSDKKQVFADIVCFDLIYQSEKKRGKFKHGTKYVCQDLSKVLYCDFTLAKQLQPGLLFRLHFEVAIPSC